MSETMIDSLKYTDRDVRDDPRLYDLARAYVQEYTGEFEPLVEAKETFKRDGSMSVQMTRKVLNCMRHDARVVGRMPRPERPQFVILKGGGDSDQGRDKRHVPKSQACENANPHRSHRYNSGDWCPGVQSGLPRYVTTHGHVKKPFVIGKHGGKIHIASGPVRYDWERDTFSEDTSLECTSFNVEVLCGIRMLQNPVLAVEEDLTRLCDERLFTRQVLLTSCTRCQDEAKKNEETK